ncbi:MAG: MFS transporter, partial [Methermicoccaceae archaeon]
MREIRLKGNNGAIKRKIESKMVFLTLYGGMFSIMGLSNTIVPILDVLAGEPLTSSLLFSAYFTGSMLSLMPFTILSGIVGYLRVMQVALLLSALSGAMLLLLSDPFGLTMARFVEGVGCGAFLSPAFASITMFKDPKRHIAQFNMILNLGVVGGMVTGGVIAPLLLKGGILLFSVSLGVTLLSSLMCTPLPTPEKLSTTGVKQAVMASITGDSIRMWILFIVVFGCTGVLLALYPLYG